MENCCEGANEPVDVFVAIIRKICGNPDLTYDQCCTNIIQTRQRTMDFFKVIIKSIPLSSTPCDPHPLEIVNIINGILNTIGIRSTRLIPAELLNPNRSVIFVMEALCVHLYQQRIQEESGAQELVVSCTNRIAMAQDLIAEINRKKSLSNEYAIMYQAKKDAIEKNQEQLLKAAKAVTTLESDELIATIKAKELSDKNDQLAMRIAECTRRLESNEQANAQEMEIHRNIVCATDRREQLAAVRDAIAKLKLNENAVVSSPLPSTEALEEMVLLLVEMSDRLQELTKMHQQLDENCKSMKQFRVIMANAKEPIANLELEEIELSEKIQAINGDIEDLSGDFVFNKEVYNDLQVESEMIVNKLYDIVNKTQCYEDKITELDWYANKTFNGYMDWPAHLLDSVENKKNFK